MRTGRPKATLKLNEDEMRALTSLTDHARHRRADEILASIARLAQRTADTQAAQLMSRTTVTGH